MHGLGELLRVRGLSLRDVAKRARMSAQTVRRACAGRLPRALFVRSLARALRLSAEETTALILAGAPGAVAAAVVSPQVKP